MSEVFGKIKGFFKNVGEKIKEGWKKIVDWFKKDGKDTVVEIVKLAAGFGVTVLVGGLYELAGGVFSPAIRILGWIGAAVLAGVLQMATERYIDSEISNAMEFKDAMTEMVQDGFEGLTFETEE